MSKCLNGWIECIYEWNKERGLLDQAYDNEREVKLLQEEINELADGMNDIDRIDALADIVVVAIGAMFKLGFKPNDVMHETLREINSRIGSVNPETGKWEKDLSLKARSEWEIADYKRCKQDGKK